jgi:hypothetical protein
MRYPPECQPNGSGFLCEAFPFSPSDYDKVIRTITFYVDDSNGAGGVRVPSSFVIDGATYNVSDPVGSAPTSYSFTHLNLPVASLGDGILRININRRDTWLFVSEITFEGHTVPEPASLALISVAAAAVPAGPILKAAGLSLFPKLRLGNAVPEALGFPSPGKPELAKPGSQPGGREPAASFTVHAPRITTPASR